ncbi:hypothetical protein H5200_00330 [Pseudoalteromonas sp. SG43-7]|uniref:hypothetical protein n=1 Tax=Pseudoalteromonas TaxID=53246 RepID=UPI001600622A|nr:hypothetical protein [Pseudoalteromonas sp. SG43-7]MBB1420372.1 hypothetical protein [Pseudoalteromonas sp. SG43-7]
MSEDIKSEEALALLIELISAGASIADSFLQYVEDQKIETLQLSNGINIRYRERWEFAAENGWFINWFVSTELETIVQEGKDALDTYMIDSINEYYQQIHKKVVTLYPKRKHIIDVAFTLHSEGNFIAAIPLFLSQSDGICSENLGSYLFTENDKRKDNISKKIEDPSDISDDVYWSQVLTKTQFSESIGKSNNKYKEKAPNRSGILHGSRKHLDYGSEINSLKCISLLAHIAHIIEFTDR